MQIADAYAPGDEPSISPLIDDGESSEITYPISDDTKKIGKSGVKLVLSHDGQHHYPLRYRLGPS
jgi:hypothetical protein